MPVPSSVASARARVGALSRHHPDSPDLDDARRDLAASSIESYVRRIVADAPPLTDEQRRHLSALLREGATDAA